MTQNEYTRTLSLAIEANLLAPTVKLLQPCKKTQKGQRRREIQQTQVQLS